MIKALSYKLTEYLMHKKIIKDEFEIYKYGFELIISYSIGCIVILMLSVILKTFYAAVIYLLSFYFLRKYTGGYHCKTYFTCNFSFILIYIIYSYLCRMYNANIYTYILYAIAFIFIWILAPCDHENKILNEAEIKKYGGISKLLLIIYSCILICFYWLVPKYIISMQLTLIIIAILLILGKIERGVEKNV